MAAEAQGTVLAHGLQERDLPAKRTIPPGG
jgi:hypothetical protein